MKQHSIGKEAAIKLAKTEFWKTLNSRQLVEFQLFTEELCMPFSVFHKAFEECLNRPVYTHEFGLNLEGLTAEFLGQKTAPTME